MATDNQTIYIGQRYARPGRPDLSAGGDEGGPKVSGECAYVGSPAGGRGGTSGASVCRGRSGAFEAYTWCVDKRDSCGLVVILNHSMRRVIDQLTSSGKGSRYR
jgi:hypothetical protein